MKSVFAIIFSISLQTCISNTAPVNNSKAIWTHKINQEGLKKAYFASGCFWCVEAIFESVKGVKEFTLVTLGVLQKTPITIKLELEERDMQNQLRSFMILIK